MTQYADGKLHQNTPDVRSKVFSAGRVISSPFTRTEGVWGPKFFENDYAGDMICEFLVLMQSGLESGRSLFRHRTVIAYTMTKLMSINPYEVRMAAQIVMFMSGYFNIKHKRRAVDALKAILDNEQWLQATQNAELIANDIQAQINRIDSSIHSTIANHPNVLSQ